MPCSTSQGPRSVPAFHQRARGRDQAGAVPPGQPHLLAGGVEGDRQPGQHPVAGPQRTLADEQPRLGVHERGGRAVRDRDPLGTPGGPRSEDHPRVVAQRRRPRPAPGRPGPGTDRAALAEHHAHRGVLPDHVRALVGIVHVDRHIGAPRDQHGQDRHVQIEGPGRHAHADLVAGPDAEPAQRAGQRLDRPAQLAVGQHSPRRFQRGGLGMKGCRRIEDVDQGPCRRGLRHRPDRMVCIGHEGRRGRQDAPEGHGRDRVLGGLHEVFLESS